MNNDPVLRDALSRLLSSFNDIERKHGRNNEIVSQVDTILKQFCKDVKINPALLNNSKYVILLLIF